MVVLCIFGVVVVLIWWGYIEGCKQEWSRGVDAWLRWVLPDMCIDPDKDADRERVYRAFRSTLPQSARCYGKQDFMDRLDAVYEQLAMKTIKNAKGE